MSGSGIPYPVGPIEEQDLRADGCSILASLPPLDQRTDEPGIDLHIGVEQDDGVRPAVECEGREPVHACGETEIAPAHDHIDGGMGSLYRVAGPIHRGVVEQDHVERRVVDVREAAQTGEDVVALLKPDDADGNALRGHEPTRARS